jgi:hypothetical protein
VIPDPTEQDATHALITGIPDPAENREQLENAERFAELLAKSSSQHVFECD